MSKLYLIRHAQASFLADDYDNLSVHGHQQSKILGNYFVQKNIHFDDIYIGPLKRHYQTYQGVKAAYGEREKNLPPATEIAELIEYQGMDTMGTVREQLVKYHPSFRTWFAEMDTNPNHKTKMKMVVTYLNMWATNTLGFDLPKGAQSFAGFRKQAEVGLQKVLAGNEKGKTIAVFSSGGCIAAMLGKIIGVPDCLLYTSPSPRDRTRSRMPSSA